jgi:SAM-dependent methyltransferase
MNKSNNLKESVCYYSDNVDDYDYLYHDHLKSSEVLLLNLLSKIESNNVKTVLDACCGSGHDVEFFLKHNFNVDASDLCQQMIDFTKMRVQKVGSFNSVFLQTNVLQLDTYVTKKYDLVIFRGNTLGHLNTIEQIKSIKQLYNTTKPGKFLLIDFREGVTHYQERKAFELRGHGIDRIRHLLYFSYYKIKHSKDFLKPYLIQSRIMKFDYFKFKIRQEDLDIVGHYVDAQAIFDLLSKLKCTYEILESDKRGLPYLKSILITKDT